MLLAVAFFLFWTLIYIGVWRWHPAGAFKGLPPTPTFSDFFYYAVSTGFVSPPGDIIAASKGARTATMIELLTGTAALAAYLGSFLDFGTAPRPRRPPPARSPAGRRPLLASDLAGVVDADVDLALLALERHDERVVEHLVVAHDAACPAAS